MKKVLSAVIALAGLAISSYSQAGYYLGAVSVERVRIEVQFVVFGVTPIPVETCSSWGETLKFDHTTDFGKVALSALLVGKASGKLIDVWYDESSVPGATEANGCGNDQLSNLYGIALSK